MKVIPPLPIVPGMIINDTVGDLMSPAAWDDGTEYAEGDLAKDASNIVWASLADSNTGNQPNLSPLFWLQVGVNEVAWDATHAYAIGDYSAYNNRVYQGLSASTGANPYLSPTEWKDIGPTNKWGRFDLLRNTATIGASPMTVKIKPGVRVNTVALVGIVADHVEVTGETADGVLFNYAVDLSEHSPITNWYDYFYATFTQQNAQFFSNLISTGELEITVTLTRANGNCSLASLVVGTSVDLGAIQYNPEDDAENFSEIDRDAFGNAVLIPRRSVPKTTQTVWAPKNFVPAIRKVREQLNAAPAVWSGLDDVTDDYFQSLLILGVYKQFTINLSYTNVAVITLELEEV